MGKAEDRLADMLEEAENTIAELESENERLRALLPWTEHYKLDEDAPDLPIPRLELEWQEGSPLLPQYDWCCRYSLVYRHLLDDVMCVPIGYTGVGGHGRPTSVDELGTPSRDGAHARSDARQLGLPLFVRHGSRYRQIDLGE